MTALHKLGTSKTLLIQKFQLKEHDHLLSFFFFSKITSIYIRDKIMTSFITKAILLYIPKIENALRHRSYNCSLCGFIFLKFIGSFHFQHYQKFIYECDYAFHSSRLIGARKTVKRPTN